MKSTLERLFPKIEAVSKEIPTHLPANKTYVSFYGATGGGKSSLICYLLSAHMTFKKHGLGYHIDHELNTKLPVIGHTANSQTQTPQLFESGEFSFFDLPGAYDTKGTEQQMINAFTNSSLFTKDRQFKLIIVIELNSIEERRGGMFIDLLKRLECMLGDDFVQIAKSCCIVVSKVSSEEGSLENITDQIKEVSQNKNLIVSGSKLHIFIDTIINNKQIIIFPLPKQIDDLLVNNILDSIRKLPTYKLKQNSKVTPSEEAKTELIAWANDIKDRIQKNFTTLASKITQTYQIQYQTVPIAQSAFNKLVQSEALATRLSDLNDFPIIDFVNSLNLGLQQANAIFQELQKIKKLKVIYQQINNNDDLRPITLQSAISTSKRAIQTQIQRIQDKLEQQRIQRENQVRLAQQKKRREQQLQRQAQERQRQARQTQARIDREAAEAKARFQQQQRQQQEQLRLHQQRVQQAQQAANQQHHRRRRGCQIM